MEDEFDPSHHLLDLASSLHDENTVKYISWGDCAKRRAELAMPASTRKRAEVVFKRTAEGLLKEEASGPEAQADTRGDLKIQNCLIRRGLALDIGDVMSFESHRKIVNRLMSSLAKEPPAAGWAQINIEQVKRADEYIFRRLAEECRTGVRRRPSGVLPLDDQIDEILREHDLSIILSHLRGSGGNGGNGNPPPRGATAADGPPNKSKSALKRERQQAAKLVTPGAAAKQQAAVAAATAAATAAAAKKAKGSSISLPKGLFGCVNKDERGEPLCYGFNLGTCSAVSPGMKCPKGWHKCMTPQCLSSAHGHKECPKR
jgi:hypothetical protein